ncbi:MAG: hypothetical protein HY22_13050 [[Candidatus Thermochlorobacteriaceae] bacterium GBChlB]|nr:MAG: hypothetical protein HY22_13050 [[Candidatus Thermochlorobacteriaceae] bacterium GBChlB]
MKIRCKILVAIFFMTSSAEAQTNFASFQAFKDSLTATASIPNDSIRSQRLDAFWNALVAETRVPFTMGDKAAFLYRGAATSVAWSGDFNGWSALSRGERLGQSDIWMLEQTLPSDARVDYKIILNGNNWILDPANPFQQLSGFGFNSELRMPNYVPSTDVVRKPNVAAGTFRDNTTIQSRQLGYSVNYRVYTPAGYNPSSNQAYPVVYVTDGHEYANDLMGSMVIVLDNLIAERRIRPLIAVFIDPRNPSNPAQNRRATEFIMNEKYLRFVSDELMAAVDSAYRTERRPDSRAILGTSFGGVNSLYFGASASSIFGLIAVQSPALWRTPELLTMYQNAARLPIKIFLTTGTMRDGENDTRRLRDILQQKAYPMFYREVNEGHSWGNWRALLDDMLLYFFPTAASTTDSKREGALQKTFQLFQNYPNPFNPTTIISYQLPTAGNVSLKVFDVLGREIATLVNERQDGGTYKYPFSTATYQLSSGVYFYRLESGGFIETRSMAVVK